MASTPTRTPTGDVFYLVESAESSRQILHRDDGPAVIRRDGTREWWCHNQLHRLDGPAIEAPTSSARVFAIAGYVLSAELFAFIAGLPDDQRDTMVGLLNAGAQPVTAADLVELLTASSPTPVSP